MKDVLVFSIALEGYSRLFRRCLETHKRYCNRFEYDYVLIDEAPRSLRPAEAAWLKIALMSAALKSDKYNWVAFLDADCELRETTPDFSHTFNEREESIFMAPGYSGRINSGVIFAKSSIDSVRFFQQVIDASDSEVPEEDQAPYENGHMIFFGKKSPDVQLIDRHKWNNNSVLSKESYIQHYSNGKLRSHFMKNLAPVEFRWGSKHDESQRTLVDIFRRLTHRVGNKLLRLLGLTRSHKPISASLDELMPYYEDNYPTLFGLKPKE